MDLEWINNARLAGAHLALTTRGDITYAEAARELIKWRPKINDLLKSNNKATKDRRVAPFTNKDRIIQLRKNFQAGRATKNEAGSLAYQYAREVINSNKHDRDALKELAVWLILTIDFGSR